MLVGNRSVVRTCVMMSFHSKILVRQPRPSPKHWMTSCCILSAALTEDVRFASLFDIYIIVSFINRNPFNGDINFSLFWFYCLVLRYEEV